MAFCPNCGKKISGESEGAFCDGCGFRIQKNLASNTTERKDNPINTEGMFQKGTQSLGDITYTSKDVAVNNLTQPKSGNKKTIGIIIGVIAAIVVLALVIALLFGGVFKSDKSSKDDESGKNYMSPMEDYMEAINEKSTDVYALMDPLKGSKITEAEENIRKELIDADAVVNNYSAKKYYENFEKECAEELEEMYDDILDEYDEFKLTFEKDKAEKKDKTDLEDATEIIIDQYEDILDRYEDMLDDEDELQDYADQYEIDEKDVKKIFEAYTSYYEEFVDCEVTEGYEVTGKFVVKVDEKNEYKTETVTLYVIKLNGNWVFAGYDGSLYFDTDGDDEAQVLQGLLYYLRNAELSF